MILSNDNINDDNINGNASSNICRLMFQKAFCKNHNIDIRVIFVYLADEKIRICPWSALFLYFILQT